MAVTPVVTAGAVNQLAAGLFDSTRSQPWVVVTSGFGSSEPEISVHDLTESIGDIAQIFTIETGELTRQLSELLPERLQVYGGAGRSYPVGFTAETPPSSSRLRFPQPTAQRAAEQLIADALGHAQAAGLFATPPARSRPASGTIAGFIAGGERAMVTLDNGGGLATVWQELTYPPIPLSWTLAAGQRVGGTLDVATRRLNVEVRTPAASDIERQFAHLSVTLALVREAAADTAKLALHPNFTLTVAAPDVTSNPHDRLDALLSVGDVVAVRVVHLAGGRLHLRLSDVDDDEPRVAPLALVPGGRPWLQANRPLPSVIEPADTALPPIEPDAAAPAPSPPTPAAAEPAAPAAAPPAARPTPGPGARLAHATPPAPAAGGDRAAPPPLATPHRAAALQSAQLSLAEAKARIATLEAQLVEAGAADSHLARLRDSARTSQLRAREALAELGELQHTLARANDELREQKRELLKSRRAAPESRHPSPEERRAQWHSEEGWVRHEIYLAWVERVPASARGTSVLAAGYRVGERFGATLRELEPQHFAKAMKAVVDVLAGLARDNESRAVHPLRVGNGSTQADMVRHDGARCFRAHIERNAPAARRLHYWVIPTGAIELSRVVTHDDMEP